ncbi:MAG TPA: type II secretion system major pseudopilin GspG [Phycisphaerae bacterium]|nr:type II secretion system major pseudopilin GspG [Phycisphaerae bacterium]HNU45282.1 type II secretion system major pseudopilin GspG [Phycisphaerae bacterium]
MGSKRRTRRSGFTLIEVLLVAGILALLAAFAIPQLFGQAEKARQDLARAAVGRNGPIGKALEAYKWDMGRYPEDDEGLGALYKAPRGEDAERWKGPYMQNPTTLEELKDPWGKAFLYKCPGQVNEDSYDLWSCGPDGKDDGGKERSDDIKNWVEQ